MTDVSNKETTPIRTFADAQSLYLPPPVAMTGKIGIEVEKHVFRPGKKGPEMIDPDEMATLQDHLKQKGYNAQLEAASVLEYASPAYAVEDIQKLLKDSAVDQQAFDDVLRSFGIEQANHAVMPTMTIEDAMTKMIDRERLQVGIKSLVEISSHGAAAVALLTAGVQVSFSPKDNDQLFRMAYRAYALTPLLLASMDSNSGFSENDPKRKNHNVRGDYYKDYGAAGGIAESFLHATDAESYINNHIQQAFKTPMYFAYGFDGLIPSTLKRIVTFDGLPEALQTRANYELAESFMYHDVKICNLRDDEGTVVGKRLEVRAADSGRHQEKSAPLMIGALVPDSETGAAFDRLLMKYGFTGNPVQDAVLFKSARTNAVYHNGKFMDVAFGIDTKTGRKGSLLAFAKDVRCLLIKHYEAFFGLFDIDYSFSNVDEILYTGRSDAFKNARKYSSLADVKHSMTEVVVAHRPHLFAKQYMENRVDYE